MIDIRLCPGRAFVTKPPGILDQVIAMESGGGMQS